jgi:apolipoprotein N-acyltransferase
MNSSVELLEGETIYVRFGDWFAWGISFISLLVVLFYWKKNSPP